MPILPYLRLYRTRILLCAVVSLSIALLALFQTSAEDLTDFGVLWHHFCGCPPVPVDIVSVLNVSTGICLFVGLILGLGVGTGVGNSATIATPGMAQIRFLLTRPTTRLYVLLAPLAIATTAIAVLPAAGLLLLLGWLSLVHAPALGHLVDIVRLIPAAANLGPHPSLIDVLRATHYGCFYLSSISIGLCAYAFYSAPRWWTRSPYRWVRLMGIFSPALVPVLPAMSFFSKRATSIAFLNQDAPLSRAAFTTLPSAPLIALHFIFAAVCLLSAWRIARTAEL